MKTHSLVSTLLTAALASACSISADGDDSIDCVEGKCDGAGGGVCTDPRYGDGTCQTSIECAVPDIDCFQTFEDDQAAATWFAAYEQRLAAEQGRPPRTLLTEAHPLFGRVRQLVDEGWRAFRKHRPVGDLRYLRPALVLIEDSDPNAFVAPDLMTGNAGFAVMVQTGLLATGGSDDGLLGVMMHELQHAVGLHVVGDTKERLRRFYIAPTGVEPIGNQQVEDQLARSVGDEWRSLAKEAGPFDAAALGGLPFHGQLDQVFKAALAQATQNISTTCAHAVGQYDQLTADLTASVDPISVELTIDQIALPGRVQQVLGALRTECFAGFTKDAIDIVATLAGVPREAIEAALPPADVALVKGKNIVDGVSALCSDRRAKMRATEAAFVADTERPWSALRYFSIEEDADDVSVPVLRGASFQPDALGAFFVSMFPAAVKARCEGFLASNEAPPYGGDLTDEHHATCWRAHHIRDVANTPTKMSVRHAPQPIARRPRLPIPRRLSDVIVY